MVAPAAKIKDVNETMWAGRTFASGVRDCEGELPLMEGHIASCQINDAASSTILINLQNEDA